MSTNITVIELDEVYKKNLESTLRRNYGHEDSTLMPTEPICPRAYFIEGKKPEETTETVETINFYTRQMAGTSCRTVFSTESVENGTRGTLIVVRAVFANDFELARSIQFSDFPTLRDNL